MKYVRVQSADGPIVEEDNLEHVNNLLKMTPARETHIVHILTQKITNQTVFENIREDFKNLKLKLKLK